MVEKPNNKKLRGTSIPLEILRYPLIVEHKEWLKTWTDEEVRRWERFLMIYRADPGIRADVKSERDKSFKAADVDEDGLLNRQELEEYFKSVNNWQTKWH